MHAEAVRPCDGGEALELLGDEPLVEGSARPLELATPLGSGGFGLVEQALEGAGEGRVR